MENYYKMQDVFSLIRTAVSQMRKSEQKVAECVIENPESILKYSITALAEKAKTSEPTVIRFCRKLGLSGYMELKLNIARDLPSNTYVFENVSATDSLPEIFNKVFISAKEAINNTMNRLSMKTLEGAADALGAAKRIEFYGAGGSGIVAMDAHHKFFRLGIPCIAYVDPHMQVMSAALLKPGHVVVAISHTGSSKDILESARIAKTSGATVIGIMGEEKTPLSKLCDFAISVHSQEVALRLAPMTSRLAQLAVVDVLFVYVAMKGGEDVNILLDRVKRSLTDKRY